ncbi:MAG: glutathione S-transferase family protein [Micropepsaceae bacterium]
MPQISFHSMEDSAYLWTVMHAADEKGVSYDLVPLTYRSPAHLTLHPFGKMPVMQHGDFFLYESAAIAHYIDRAFEGPALQPSDVKGQACVLRWISVVNAYVFPTMNRFMKERLVKPLYGGKPDVDFLTSAREPLLLQMHLIDNAVKGTAFLEGDAVTLADSFLFPQLLFFGKTPEGALLLEKSTHASAWLRRMMDRNSYVGGRMARAYEAFKQIPVPTKLVWTVG